jgi:hypothetical protein
LQETVAERRKRFGRWIRQRQPKWNCGELVNAGYVPWKYKKWWWAQDSRFAAVWMRARLRLLTCTSQAAMVAH